MATNLLFSELWSDVLTVRERSPLVHSITNLVAINFNVNTLLAAGRVLRRSWPSPMRKRLTWQAWPMCGWPEPVFPR